MTVRNLTYFRVPADRVRRLFGIGTKPQPFGSVRLVERNGAVFVADEGAPGSVVYTGYTFTDLPGIGEVDVLYPEAGLTDHGYVTNKGAVK